MINAGEYYISYDHQNWSLNWIIENVMWMNMCGKGFLKSFELKVVIMTSKIE